jgi:hypothetical protein
METGNAVAVAIASLPPDCLLAIAGFMSPLDLSRCRMTCRGLREGLPAPRVPAALAMEGAELLAWCVDEAGLSPGVPLLRAASASRDASLDALMLAAAMACSLSGGRRRERGALLSALHGAACASALRWGEPGPVADLLSDCWAAGRVSPRELAVCRPGAERAICAAAVSGRERSGASKGRLLCWLCRQGLAGPEDALAAAAGSCDGALVRSGEGSARECVAAVADLVETWGLRVDATRALVAAATAGDLGAAYEIMERSGRSLFIDERAPELARAALG